MIRKLYYGLRGGNHMTRFRQSYWKKLVRGAIKLFLQIIIVVIVVGGSSEDGNLGDIGTFHFCLNQSHISIHIVVLIPFVSYLHDKWEYCSSNGGGGGCRGLGHLSKHSSTTARCSIFHLVIVRYISKYQLLNLLHDYQEPTYKKKTNICSWIIYIFICK